MNYYYKNQDKCLENANAYYHENKEKIKDRQSEYFKIYYEKNKEAIKLRTKATRKENRRIKREIRQGAAVKADFEIFFIFLEFLMYTHNN